MKALFWMLLVGFGVVSASAEEPIPEISVVHGAKLELQEPESGYVHGRSLAMTVVNTGDEDWVYHYPGASNGCGSWYGISLTDAKGNTWSAVSPLQMCAAVEIPGFDVTIPAGKAEVFAFDGALDQVWYRVNGLPDAENGVRLKPGKYTLQLGLGHESLSVPIWVRAR